MGIGFVDSIIVYNQYKSKTLGEEYFGTRFDNVRVELTEGATIVQSGIENASKCIVKIEPDSVEKSGKEYRPPKVWLKSTTEEMLQTFTFSKDTDFFVIVKKAELGIDVDLPVGEIQSDSEYSGYDDGFFEYVKTKFGYAYTVSTVDVYTVIPRFEIGGK